MRLQEAEEGGQYVCLPIDVLKGYPVEDAQFVVLFLQAYVKGANAFFQLGGDINGLRYQSAAALYGAAVVAAGDGYFAYGGGVGDGFHPFRFVRFRLLPHGFLSVASDEKTSRHGTQEQLNQC